MRIFTHREEQDVLYQAYWKRLENLIITGIKLNILLAIHGEKSKEFFDPDFLPSLFPFIASLSIEQAMPKLRETCESEIRRSKVWSWQHVANTFQKRAQKTSVPVLVEVEDAALSKLQLQGLRPSASEALLCLLASSLVEARPRVEFKALLKAHRARLWGFFDGLRADFEALEVDLQERCPALAQEMWRAKKHFFAGDIERRYPHFTSLWVEKLLLDFEKFFLELNQKLMKLHQQAGKEAPSSEDKEEIKKNALLLQNAGELICGYCEKLRNFLDDDERSISLIQKSDGIYKDFAEIRARAHIVFKVIRAEKPWPEYSKAFCEEVEKKVFEYSQLHLYQLEALDQETLVRITDTLFFRVFELELIQFGLKENPAHTNELNRVQSLLEKLNIMLKLLQFHKEAFNSWPILNEIHSCLGRFNFKKMHELRAEVLSFETVEAELKLLFQRALVFDSSQAFCSSLFEDFSDAIASFKNKVTDAVASFYSAKISLFYQKIEPILEKFQEKAEGLIAEFEIRGSCLHQLRLIDSDLARAIALYRDRGFFWRDPSVDKKLTDCFSYLDGWIKQVDAKLAETEAKIAESQPKFFADDIMQALEQMQSVEALIDNFINGRPFKKLCAEYVSYFNMALPAVEKWSSQSTDPQVFEYVKGRLQELSSHYSRLGGLSPIGKGHNGDALSHVIHKRAKALYEARLAYDAVIASPFNASEVKRLYSEVQPILMRLKRDFISVGDFQVFFLSLPFLGAQHKKYFAEYFSMQEGYFNQLRNEILDYAGNLQQVLSYEELASDEDKENKSRFNLG